MDITTDQNMLSEWLIECFLQNNWRQLSIFDQKYLSFTKTYKSFLGNRTANVWPRFWKTNDRIAAGFEGDFTSKGENALAVFSVYIKHGMSKEDIAQAITDLTRQCDINISKSFVVKLLRFHYQHKGAFLKKPFSSIYVDKRLMGNPLKTAFCQSCQCVHSHVI